MIKPDKATIFNDILDTLEKVGEDWEFSDEITLETYLLGDLGMESIDVVGQNQGQPQKVAHVEFGELLPLFGVVGEHGLLEDGAHLADRIAAGAERPKHGGVIHMGEEEGADKVGVENFGLVFIDDQQHRQSQGGGGVGFVNPVFILGRHAQTKKQGTGVELEVKDDALAGITQQFGEQLFEISLGHGDHLPVRRRDRGEGLFGKGDSGGGLHPGEGPLEAHQIVARGAVQVGVTAHGALIVFGVKEGRL